MKIAVPTNEGRIDNHFGHCPGFTVFTVNDKNEIVDEKTFESPQGCGCKSNLVTVLSGMGVTHMLAGGMGAGAVNVLSQHGIQVISGLSGNVKTVAQAWLDGKLSDLPAAPLCDHSGCNH